MNLPRFVVIAVLILITVPAWSQFYTPKNYPQGYFDWPVKATKGLAANFGELRNNHYHMGFDCRTEQRQNLPVLAAADGYIAKVKIEPLGFGKAIYINHPNGYTTLYAHLNSFYPELEQYVTEQQYLLKSWKVFLDIPPGKFPVKKGMFIANSGNAGASQGPHMHFEIRDTKTDKVLNPSLFDFPLPDNVPPIILRLAVYDRSISTYEQTPKLYAVKKVKGEYVLPPITTGSNKISFGISAIDRYTGSTNPNGIYEAVVYDNDQPVIGFRIDGIGYDETRYLNAHIDYKLRSSGGPWVEHLSRLPGYTNSIYNTKNGDGIILLNDDSAHQVKITVADANGNVSVLRFSIKHSGTAIPAANASNTQNAREFIPGYINLYENNTLSFYLPENALYDSIRFRYSEQPVNDGYTIYQLHNVSVPVHCYFPVKIKATSSLPDKMVMHRFANGKNDFAKATFENGWYKASFRDFGNFQLMIDTIPPAISPLGFKDGMNAAKLSSLKFVVTDNTEVIKNFTATLDGNWLRFTNDKGRVFVYIFDDHCQPGEHELKITAEDQVGNVSERVYHFTK
ncbi:MAG: M23 family metallopeptidase [Bacteroidetes bacterium]|nr:M23 family metallopeptidase [Bacteroidota bacterium]